MSQGFRVEGWGLESWVLRVEGKEIGFEAEN